jgi:hypothetical protein
LNLDGREVNSLHLEGCKQTRSRQRDQQKGNDGDHLGANRQGGNLQEALQLGRSPRENGSRPIRFLNATFSCSATSKCLVNLRLHGIYSAIIDCVIFA